MSENAKEKFEQEQINRSGEDWNFNIGWSSPWVVSYEIEVEDITANIVYSMETSEPANYTMKETLAFIRENDEFVVDDYQTIDGLNSGQINASDYEISLINTYLNHIQDASDDFYNEYFTISPTVTYDYICVKEISVDGSINPTSNITFKCMPFVSAHWTVGTDEITFSADFMGNIELKEFKHTKSYSLPEHLKNLIIKPIPGEYEDL